MPSWGDQALPLRGHFSASSQPGQSSRMNPIPPPLNTPPPFRCSYTPRLQRRDALTRAAPVSPPRRDEAAGSWDLPALMIPAQWMENMAQHPGSTRARAEEARRVPQAGVPCTHTLPHEGPGCCRGVGGCRHGSSKTHVLPVGMTPELSPPSWVGGWAFDLSVLKQRGFQRTGAVGNAPWVWAACKSLPARERLVGERIRTCGWRRRVTAGERTPAQSPVPEQRGGTAAWESCFRVQKPLNQAPYSSSGRRWQPQEPLAPVGESGRCVLTPSPRGHGKGDAGTRDSSQLRCHRPAPLLTRPDPAQG